MIDEPFHEGQPVLWRVKRGRGFVEHAARVRFNVNARRVCIELEDGGIFFADKANVTARQGEGRENR